MNVRTEMDRLVKRFCVWLGRYRTWSKLLDGISTLICPSFVSPFLLPAAVGNLSPLMNPIFLMRRNPDGSAKNPGEGGVYDSNPGPRPSPRPDGGDPGDPPHSSKCAPLKYHGMHGAPCALNFDSDGGGDSCPSGTVSGMWWRFHIHGLGNVYYIDCCGLNINWKVWCRWAKEPNWCAGHGNNIYTCTLTILQGAMHVGSDGFADPVYFDPP